MALLLALLCIMGAVAHTLAAPAYSNAWAGVRGLNYVPSYSSNPVQTWMDYDAATIERELGFAQSVKLNTVRVFIHMFPWRHNRTAFLRNYDHFVAACAEKGIKPLVVVFDDDFYDAGLPNVTDWGDIDAWLATGQYRGATWMANPGMTLLSVDAASSYWVECTKYLLDVLAGTRANDERILGYDLMNEPHNKAPWGGGLQSFIDTMLHRAQNETTVLTTVDEFTTAPGNLDKTERALSMHSYWHFDSWQQCKPNATSVCQDQAARGKSFHAKAAKLGKPVLVSEMGQFDCYCPSAMGFTQSGVGWIGWELMLRHDQFSSFTGMVYANGTWRSEDEADCLRHIAFLAANGLASCATAAFPMVEQEIIT